MHSPYGGRRGMRVCIDEEEAQKREAIRKKDCQSIMASCAARKEG